MRRTGQAQRASMSAIFERFCTPPGRMRRRPKGSAFRTRDTSSERSRHEPMLLELGDEIRLADPQAGRRQFPVAVDLP